MQTTSEPNKENRKKKERERETPNKQNKNSLGNTYYNRGNFKNYKRLL